MNTREENEKLRALLREIRPTIPRDVLELWCKDRDSALSQQTEPVEPAPAQDEREAVVVVGYAYNLESGAYSQYPGADWSALMTVAQHERIVAALSRPAQTEQQPVAWRRMEADDNESANWSYYSGPVEGGVPVYAAPITQTAPQPELTVWEGSMPESNGKSNFTAILMRKGGTLFNPLTDGFTIARSEYPDRVRYEADCVRWLIGELKEKPCITDYDADKHSGYAAPIAQSAPQPEQSGLVAVAEINREYIGDLRLIKRTALKSMPDGTKLYAALPATPSHATAPSHE